MSSSIFQLEPVTRTMYRRAIAHLKREGIDVITTSTRRTRAEQQVLFDRFGRGEAFFPVAKPGTSTHEQGIAVDLVPKKPQDLPRVVQVMGALGFKWAGAEDRVHFTFTGTPGAAALAAGCVEMNLPLPRGFELC